VLPDGSLGPIQTRPSNPRRPTQGAAPAATISKYDGCSKEELLQKVKDIRAQKELLEKKKFPTPGQRVKLAKNEEMEFYAHCKELGRLNQALKKMDPDAVTPVAPENEGDDKCADDEAAAGGEGAAGGEAAAVAFSSSDDGGEEDA
jgi:hypothetical protein